LKWFAGIKNTAWLLAVFCDSFVRSFAISSGLVC
jgi:hypothetical protein